MDISDGVQEATALRGPYLSLYGPKSAEGIARIGSCSLEATEACSVIVVVVLMSTDFVLDLVVVWPSQVGLEVEGLKTSWIEVMIDMIEMMRGRCDRVNAGWV